MSAKKAAEALFQFDQSLRTYVEVMFANRAHHAASWEEKVDCLRAAKGTWTLSLAAGAAGVSEEAVLTALAQHHLHCGTLLCAKGAVHQAMQ